MKRTSLSLLSALITLLFFASCGNKGGKTGLLVPKDAMLVMHINTGSLLSKLSWEEIKQAGWFKENSKEVPDGFRKQLLDNPAISGVDVKAGLVLFMKKQGKGGYMVFQGSLKDSGEFEKMLKEMTKDEYHEIKKDGDFSSMALDRKSALVWNKSKFILIANANLPERNYMRSRESYNYRERSLSSDSLTIYAKQTLKMGNGDKLDTDSRFADLVSDGKDIHFWIDAGRFYSALGGGMMSLMKIESMFKDNIATASLSFENGKINIAGTHYMGEELRKLMEKNKPEPLTADVLNRIPASRVAAVFAFNFKPEALLETLKMTGLDGMANEALAEINYSAEELVEAMKGEFLVSVSDISMVKKYDTIKYGNNIPPYVYSHTRPDVKVLVAASVKNKGAFDKLVDGITEVLGKERGLPEISHKIENNWFAISNSAEQTDKFVAGGNNKFPFTDELAGHPFGLYIDIQELIRSFGSDAGEEEKASVDASLSMWQDIIGTGGDFKDGAGHFNFEINLVDKNTNSLKQLNQYFDKLYNIRQERRKKMEEYYKGPIKDSLIEAPPAMK